MTSYTMTETEASRWESDDAAERESARREIRERVRSSGGGEVYSYDGVTMDAIAAEVAP